MRKFLYCCGALLITGCSSSEAIPPSDWQAINGRDELLTPWRSERRPVYRARVPPNWVRIDQDPHIQLLDTTKPNVTFLIGDTIRLNVHTFPTDSFEERIPPAFQVDRWKSQVDKTCRVESISRGGFLGMYFEGKKNEKTILAWSMQLDLDHYQTLSFIAASHEDKEHFKQMGADYTIKAEGPACELEKHKQAIFQFAKSFELLQNIPERP